MHTTAPNRATETIIGDGGGGCVEPVSGGVDSGTQITPAKALAV